jgi:uncharacterized protein YukE
MKTIRLTETDINRLVKKVLIEQEQNEGILDPIKNAYSGLKGAWRGDGYDYYKYLSSLRGSIRELKRLDKPNHKIMGTLNDLVNKMSTSKMDNTKKDNIISAVNAAQSNFENYTRILDDIERLISKKIN